MTVILSYPLGQSIDVKWRRVNPLTTSHIQEACILASAVIHACRCISL